ncbi:MAG: HIG1 domain-containing protein [Alphaproteobacteria bacterium]
MFKTILTILLIVALIAVGITMLRGVFSMFGSGDERKEKSQGLMQKRVMFQAVALILLAALLFIGGSS